MNTQYSHSTVIICVLSSLVLLFAAGCDDSGNEATVEAPEKSVTKKPSKDKGEKQALKQQKEQDTESSNRQQAKGEKGAKAVDKSKLPDDMKEGTTQTFGGDLTVEGDPISLKKALEKGPTSKEKPVKVAAKITKVCQKKGCWFKLTDDGVEQSIRVRMQGYDFFVPRNTAGGEAVVQGYLQSREVPESEVEHYASDQGEDVDVDGPKKTVEFMASAVQITL